MSRNNPLIATVNARIFRHVAYPREAETDNLTESEPHYRPTIN